MTLTLAYTIPFCNVDPAKLITELGTLDIFDDLPPEEYGIVSPPLADVTAQDASGVTRTMTFAVTAEMNAQVLADPAAAQQVRYVYSDAIQARMSTTCTAHVVVVNP
jgi:hypothetical protein